MMRKDLTLALAVLLVTGPVLAGCNGNFSLAEAPNEVQSPTPPVEPPDQNAKTDLRLVRDGVGFGLGESIDEMYQVFGNPKTSFEFSDLPPGFGPPYSAKGWETAREGVGAILYDNKVVAVMRQLTRATNEQLSQLVDTTRQENLPAQPQVIQGARVVYYFWDKSPQRIMISGLNTRNDAWHITEALGDDKVMDAIGASPTKAAADKATVDSKLSSAKG